jgi:hypothetical protein
MDQFTDNNSRTWTYQEVVTAMDGELYPMSLVGAVARLVQQVVNQGIDSHLEACFVPDRGDAFTWTPRKLATGEVHTVALDCTVSPESMPVLLRRLFEFEGDDQAYDQASHLAQDILDTIVGELD